jgi:hypothetical protein
MMHSSAAWCYSRRYRFPADLSGLHDLGWMRVRLHDADGAYSCRYAKSDNCDADDQGYRDDAQMGGAIRTEDRGIHRNLRASVT